jgi:hypothetical protein
MAPHDQAALEAQEQVLAVGRSGDHRCLVYGGGRFSESSLWAAGGDCSSGKRLVQSDRQPVQGVAFWHNRSISISERAGYRD